MPRSFLPHGLWPDFVVVVIVTFYRRIVRTHWSCALCLFGKWYIGSIGPFETKKRSRATKDTLRPDNTIRRPDAHGCTTKLDVLGDVAVMAKPRITPP